MTAILCTLSDRELLLHQRTSALTGTMEDKMQQLRSSTIIEEYKQLHKEYLTLLQASCNKQEQLELLKRLVFLNWYQLVEPSIYTGLEELDEEVVQAAYDLLDTWLSHSALDQEFQWMLSYYASWEYAILFYSKNRLPMLTAFIEAVDQSALHLPQHQLPRHSMDNRGLMGRYWQSVGVEIS
jgi:hypothetical protein